jgi:hypothetical protein
MHVDPGEGAQEGKALSIFLFFIIIIKQPAMAAAISSLALKRL